MISPPPIMETMTRPKINGKDIIPDLVAETPLEAHVSEMVGKKRANQSLHGWPGTRSAGSIQRQRTLLLDKRRTMMLMQLFAVSIRVGVQ